MKQLALPRNTNQWVSLAGFAIVVMLTLGVIPFWPRWILPVIGGFLGWVVVDDTKNFLIAGLALVGAKWGLTHVPVVGHLIQDFAQNLIGLVAPAMLVVAVRALYREMKG